MAESAYERYQRLKKEQGQQNETASQRYARLSGTQKDLSSVANDISSRLDEYQKNLQSYVSYYNNRAGKRQPGVYVNDSKDYADLTSRQKAWYDATSRDINSLLDNYGSSLGKDYVDSVKNFLSSNGKLVDQINQTAMSDDQYWSKYTPEQYEKTYDQYIYGQKYKNASSGDLVRAIDDTSTTDREKEWLLSQGYASDSYIAKRRSELQAEIDRLSNDTEAKVSNRLIRPIVNNVPKEQERLNELRAELEQLDAIERSTKKTRQMAGYEQKYGLSAEEWAKGVGNNQDVIDYILDNSNFQDFVGTEYGYFTDNELDTYGYLISQGDVETANRFLTDYTPILNQRKNQAMVEAIQAAPAWAKVALNVLSVPANVIGGIPAGIDSLFQQISGTEYDPYSGAQSLRNFASAVRSVTGQSLDEVDGSGKLSMLYNAGMSTLDSLAGGLTLGRVNPLEVMGFNPSGLANAMTNLYSLTMMGNAGATEAQRLYEKGASASQVFWGGTLAGIAEGLFEYVSLDKLLKDSNPATWRQVVLNVLKQAGVEGSEEVATSIANTLTNAIVMGQRSDISEDVNKMVAGYYDDTGVWHDGVTREEAQKKALLNKVEEIVEDFVTGAISGGLSSAIYGGANAVHNVKTGTDINKAGTAAGLVNAGLNTLDTKSQTYKTAQRLNNQLEKGKSLTGINARMGLGSLLSTGLETTTEEYTRAQERLLNRAVNSDEIIKTAMKEAGISEENFDSVRTLVNNENTTDSEATDLYNKDEAVRKVVDDLRKENAEISNEALGREVNVAQYKAVLENLEESKASTPEQVRENVQSLAEVHIKTKDGRVDEGVVNKIVEGYDAEMQKKMTSNAYARAAVEAYNFGITGQGLDVVARKEHLSSMLSDTLQKQFYNLGVIAQGDEGARQVLNGTQGKAQQGTVVFEKAVRGNQSVTDVIKSLEKGDDNAKAQAERINTTVEALRKFSGATGIKIHLYASSVRQSQDNTIKRFWVNEKGEEVTSNGFYRPGTSEIWVDVNSGANGDSLIMFTVAHELTHLIKNFSPASFRTLAQFLVDEYKDGKKSVDMYVKEQMQISLNNGIRLSYADAFEEFVAESMTDMFSDGQVFEKIIRLAKKDAKLTKKMESELGNIAEKLRKVYAGLRPDSKLGKVFENMKDKFEKLQNLFSEAVVTASKEIKTLREAGFSAEEIKDLSNVKNSERIKPGMTDSERAEILSQKHIDNIPVAPETISQEIVDKVKTIKTWDDINKLFGSERLSIIKKLATEFGAFKAYFNKDADIKFSFSGNNFRESYNKQSGDYLSFAKLFNVFDDVIENAVGIEVHNRNSEGYKIDPSLNNVYVLISAFNDGNQIIPVKLEVKEFNDKKNSLYVAITTENKKAGVWKSESSNDVAQSSRPVFDNSIAQIMGFVNPSETNFTKYFPKSMLTPEQARVLNGEKHSERLNYFDKQFETTEDGRLKPRNVNDLSTEDWGLIQKAVKKLGYEVRSAKEAKEIYGRYVGESGFNKEQSDAIRREYGVSEKAVSSVNPERASRAVKEFGLTTDFREAGYLLPDGRMLDFSGKREGGSPRMRAMDHREINRVFSEGDVNTEAYETTPYMNAFIEEGNIRLMDEQGVTIGGIEPTKKQYDILKLFIDRCLRNSDYFYLDLQNKDGYTVESREYDEGDNPAKIISEIKAYFKNGELPYRSELSQFYTKYSERIAKQDEQYLELAKDPDKNEAKLAVMVEQAARRAGYNSPKLYHGTQVFGFTKFDLNRMDDKRSIFLTSDPTLASTYSGTKNVRKTSDIKSIYDKIADMPLSEVVERLNEENKRLADSEENNFDYSLYTLKGANNLISSVNDRIDKLSKRVDELIKEYTDRLARRDFSEDDFNIRNRLKNLKSRLDRYDYNNLPTPIWYLLNSDKARNVFNGDADIVQLEKDIRLLNEVRRSDLNGGVIIRQALDGYILDTLNEVEAKKELRQKVSTGNYSLYAKLGRCLEIDAQGQYWNRLKNWRPKYSLEKTHISKSGHVYSLVDNETGKTVKSFDFSESLDPSLENRMTDEQKHILLIGSINGVISIQNGEYSNTRGVSKFASEQGYDSVHFKNIKDNGGRHAGIDPDYTSDVYIIFNPYAVKSADPVTYDDNGNVIPLSERFNEGNEDIRYSLRGYTKDGRSIYETDFDDTVTEDERVKYFKDRIATIFNLGMVELKTDSKKIIVKGDKYTAQKNIYGNYYISDDEQKALFNSLYDLADILSKSKYDSNATEKEPSYANPAINPKNPAHKGVKYWYKFRNSIVLDGVGYDVTFNVRDKGKEQLQYLIEFKKNKTSNLSNTVYKDLLRTGSTSNYQNYTTTSPESQEISEKNLENSKDFHQERAKSNREILSEALESATQNEIEAKRLAEYKSKVEQADELQAYLSELRDRIFGKADKKGQTVREIQDEIRKTNNRIDIIDKQLLRLEAMAPIQRILNREKAENAKLLNEQVKLAESRTIAEYEERSRELVAKYGDRLKERYSLAEQKAKIKKDIKELNKLFKADKEKRVKKGMTDLAAAQFAQAALMIDPAHIANEEIVRAGVSKVSEQESKWLNRYADTLSAIEEAQDAIRTLRSQEITPDIQKKIDGIQQTIRKSEGTISYLNGKLKELFARERTYYAQATAKGAMQSLATAYRELKNSSYAYIQNSFDESVAEYIDNLADEDFMGKSFRDMTSSELEQIHKAYRMVLHTIKRANTLFRAGRNETVAETSDKVMTELKQVKKGVDYRSQLNKDLNRIGWQFLKPIYAFRMLGSETLMDLYQNIRSGEDTWMVNIQKAKEHIQSLRRKYGYYKWKNNTIEAESRFGEKFKLTREQAMSLYAYSRRGEQAINHITGKGIVLSEDSELTVGKKIKRKVTRADTHAYSITTEELNRIINQLTEDERGYVVEAQKYLSEDMAKLGNEVSMLLYGVELFGEKNYFPLRSSGAQMQKEIRDNAPSLAKLKNAGFSQSTIKRANNAVVLSEFDNVWTDHVNEMIMYNAFVPALEDFEKVYGRQNTDTKYGSDNVRTTIDGTWGAGANRYISELLQDINAGRPSDTASGVMNTFTSLMKKGATFLSASVAIQQGSAVARAMAYVDPKYFVGNPLLLKHNEKWEELKKYAPIAAIKEMGYFDTNMGRSTREWLNSGEYEGLRQKIGAFFKDGQYRDELLSKAPSFVDEVGWIQIWEAVKKETRAQTNLEGEELLKKAAERFTEVVQLTQVYDSVFSRSGLMRSRDTGVKMATAFMAESTTQLNMILDAVVQGMRGNKKFVPKAFGALLFSIILNTVLKSIVTAARDKDKDKTYAEKYLNASVSDILDNVNPLTMIPWVKDAISIWQGYDVERTDMSVVADALNGLKAALNDEKPTIDRITAAVSGIGQLTGVPAKNILRDLRAVGSVIEGIKNKVPTTKTGLNIAAEEGLASSFLGKTINLFGKGTLDDDYSNAQELYKAYTEGDMEHAERVAVRYKDAQTATTQFTAQVKAHYQSGDISKDEAETLLKEFTGKDDDDIYWLMDKWDYVGDDYSKYSDLFEAVSSGVNLKATVNEYLDHGVSKQTLTSQITSQYKPLYKSMTRAERAAIKGYLMNAYSLLGYTRVEASKKIDAWLTEN